MMDGHEHTTRNKQVCKFAVKTCMLLSPGSGLFIMFPEDVKLILLHI